MLASATLTIEMSRVIRKKPMEEIANTTPACAAAGLGSAGFGTDGKLVVDTMTSQPIGAARSCHTTALTAPAEGHR